LQQQQPQPTQQNQSEPLHQRPIEPQQAAQPLQRDKPTLVSFASFAKPLDLADATAVPTWQLVPCASCGARQTQPDAKASAAGVPESFRRCVKCKSTYYCSERCQRYHWAGAHKAQCRGIPTTGRHGGGGGNTLDATTLPHRQQQPSQNSFVNEGVLEPMLQRSQPGLRRSFQDPLHQQRNEAHEAAYLQAVNSATVYRRSQPGIILLLCVCVCVCVCLCVHVCVYTCVCVCVHT
jgi:hypothetical protein